MISFAVYPSLFSLPNPQPIYYAYSKEYAFFFWQYFLFGGFHVAFAFYMLIGIPSTGSAGLINTIAMAAQAHWAAFVLGCVSAKRGSPSILFSFRDR